MAKRKGWRQCGKCKHMIERSVGCNMMRCRCGYEFRYACGKQWNSSSHYQCHPHIDQLGNKVPQAFPVWLLAIVKISLCTMAPDNNPFSMSTMSNALQHIRGFAPRASDVPDTRLKRLFNLMTRCEGVGQFKDLTSTFDQSQLQMMASLLTSDSEYFMEVVSNKYGSRRVQKLLGISDDVDAFFYGAILQRFFDIMTDKYASYVAIRATVVFDQVKKHVMYKYVLHYALDIARKQHGCIALNEVLTDADDPLYRNRLLDVVARDALFLSNDPWGNFVCDGDRLMRLARSEFGNFVVLKALNVTQEMNRVDLFWDLVQKLMPLRPLLLRSHGNNIANVLETCSIATRYSN
ncbi:hypothetical protein HID58_051118 [Brassica napus]|uniref:RING-type domain-containing protein n=1 Tax=Brassica napus TaxID=3708 RepID=A0ABQ8A825_BRANA|nr:hypothetical protein HID58_051118 [Brassica napus]